MTDDEINRRFREMKIARDKARDDLCIARREAKNLSGLLLTASQGMVTDNGIGWRVTGQGLRFGPIDHSVMMDSSLPTEAELLSVLGTIHECERVIAEYDELVR